MSVKDKPVVRFKSRERKPLCFFHENQCGTTEGQKKRA
jgi:hypothetical protein